ncbi:asparagine synthetase B family protein [Motilimonas pumila]|uniref:asparagine synthase (glutamine-hydrolyzing) n=1 Tax=Motilimonas pumila TaxID=2303987 RepID=A0A418YJ54_9GAMM|nr:asparagine synthetase B family protein [Motilimonas pumila]RJG50647.1 asparagine synthase [Motilimonas pumila]
MDAFVGIVSPSRSPLKRCDALHQQQLGRMQLASSQPDLLLPPQAGSSLSFFGRPQWQSQPLCRQQSQQDFQLSFQKDQQRALDTLNGSFVLLAYQNERLSLFTDPFASQGIYYCQLGERFMFANKLGLLLQQLPQMPELDPQAIYHYLYFHMIPSPDTIYQGIKKMRPGEKLEFDKGQLTTHNYFQPQFVEQTGTSHTKLAEQLQHTLADAVARNVDTGSTGSFLSGGLDSSTITGLLNQQQPQSPSFSIGFDVEKYNELPWARLTSRHFNSQSHEYTVTADETADIIPIIAAGQDEPFGNSSVIPTYFCARFAQQQGQQVLLAGDGGDELFAGNERYAKQQVFELYHKLPRPLRQQVFDRSGQSSWCQRTKGLQKLASYVNQANVPLPDRLQSYNFIHRMGAKHFLKQDFIESIHLAQPDKMNRTRYHQPANASSLNRMLWLDWKHTLADNDLKKVSNMCQLAGVEVRYPMLDREVVDLSCQIPSNMKLPFGKLRHFYKQSFKSFLPLELQTKPKHGFGLPFGMWAKQHKGLQSLAQSGIATLSDMDIFNPDLLHQVTHLHQQEHAEYYGEMMWILMMLGLWMQQHQDLKLAFNRDNAA